MTDEQFREIALAFDGAIEGSHMGHPDFRGNGRVYASLRADGATGMVKLTPDQQVALLDEHPGIFSPAAGAWGRGGYTVVVLARARAAAVRTAMTLAWEGVMAMPRARRAGRSGPGGRSSTPAKTGRRSGREPARRP